MRRDGPRLVSLCELARPCTQRPALELDLELLRSTRDQKEIERISRTIAKLYGQRVLLHRNPERYAA